MTHVERKIVETNRVSHRVPKEHIEHMVELRSQGLPYMEIRDHMKEEHSLHLSLSSVQYWTDEKYRESKKEKNRKNHYRRTGRTP